MITYSIKMIDAEHWEVRAADEDEPGSYLAITLNTKDRAEHWIETRRDLDKSRPPREPI